MPLLTVKLEDIIPIDCGEWGVFKRAPRYRLFVLLHDSFLLGKHEVRLTTKEIFEGPFCKTTSEMFLKGRNKFIKEILGCVFDREEVVGQVVAKIDEGRLIGVSGEIVVSIVREKFDDVKFSNITELKLRRNSLWSNMRTIDIRFQGGSISFRACEFNYLFGMSTNVIETEEIFTRIQNGVNTYRR